MNNEQRDQATGQIDPREERLEQILEGIRHRLPEILYRTDRRFREFVGLSPLTVKRHDHEGTGPAERVRHGRHVGYPKDALIEYIRKHLTLEHFEDQEGGEAA